MNTKRSNDLIHVGSLEEIREKGVILAKGAQRPVAVFYSDGNVSAVDNRCPHLGFPLHKGTVSDGRLTCHWHEARFDLCSGCTFDLWADDVPVFDTEIRDGEVYVSSRPRQKEDSTYYKQRLDNGLRHNVNLVQAKAILGLRKHGVEPQEILASIAEFGSRSHEVWGSGMTILTIVANLAPHLQEQTLNHALIRASREVAQQCFGMPQPRKRAPLGVIGQPPEQLKRWLRDGIKGRQRDASERALQSALMKEGAVEAYFTAASDRVYTNSGHEFDSINKAFELLDHISWRDADLIVPLTLQPVLSMRGSEESASWHSPTELIEPLREIESRLAEVLESPRDETWKASREFTDLLFDNDALTILKQLEAALVEGAPPIALAEAVACTAAQRLSRFAKSNEVGDWFSPQHTFIFCNAVCQAIRRAETPDVVRNLFHGALAVYQDRFLNVPKAKLPSDSEIASLPTDQSTLLKDLLAQFDQRGEWNSVGKLVARYLRLNHPLQGLIDTLTFATIREDLDFHTLQVLEAAASLAQYLENDSTAIEHLFIGTARQLDAVSPTPRASYKLSLTAARLGRGDMIFED